MQIMEEMNEQTPNKKGFLDRILDKFRNTAKDVSDKVEDTINEAKESELGEKVAETAKNLGEKAKDLIEDVKESEFVDKVGDKAEEILDKTKNMSQDAANFCSSKMKSAIGKIDFDKTLNSLKEKQESSGKDLSVLINFVEKLQNIK